MGRLPDCRDVGSLNRQVEKMGGVADAKRPKMLHVEHGETIWASSRRILALFDSVDCVSQRMGCMSGPEGYTFLNSYVSFLIPYLAENP